MTTDDAATPHHCPTYWQTRWALAVGLAFVFAYFGVDKFAHPLIWIGWLPSWMDGFLGIEKETWLQATAVMELLIGIALLVPLYWVQKIAALIAGLHLVAVLTQTGWNDIAVRDIGLLLMALGLWFVPRK